MQAKYIFNQVLVHFERTQVGQLGVLFFYI